MKGKKLPSPSENAIQRQLFEEWRLRGVRPSLAFSVPNEAAGRNAALRRAGVMPGIPDTWWITEGQITALELKARGRKPTPEQDHVMALLRSLGIAAFWTDDLREALAILEGRGVLRAGGQLRL